MAVCPRRAMVEAQSLSDERVWRGWIWNCACNLDSTKCQVSLLEQLTTPFSGPSAN